MGENTPAYFKESVSKYHIPLDHLDFGYINKCNDVKELEKIYKVLKSGDEGTYLDLEKCCEDKLTKLHPNSRALRKATPLLKLSDINKEERKDIEDDLQNWTSNMATLDDTLKSMASKATDSQDKPPIRCPENLKARSEKSEKRKPPPVSKKPVMPRGYKEWDKFDIEKELIKADTKMEEKKKTPNADSNLSETVNVNPDTLEDTKQAMATREKDKGNEAFRSADYNEAVIYYNRSLSICPSDVVYNNRALVYLKLHRWDDAIGDCNKVFENEKNNIKALLRRATAYKEKGEHNKALCDLKQVLVLEPENQRAKQILQEVESKWPASAKKETETVPKKKKSRKMVIEDVEGIEDESAKLKDKSQPTLLLNGLPDKADTTKSSEKSDEKSEEVALSDTTKGRGDGQSGKASKQKKNIKNKLDAKSSMSGDNSLSNQDKCPASNVKQGEASGDPPVHMGQATSTENSKGKKDSQESASISCDKNLKTAETLISTPKVLIHWPLPSRVESVKKSGNDMFQRGRYAEALKFYTHAIDMLQEKSADQTVNLSLIYSNRAACCLKIGNCQGSIADCATSLDLVPHAIKPLLRRAAAYETLERYGFAYIDYKHVLAIDSSVEVAQQGSSRCSQTLIQLQGYSWREKLPPMVTVHASDLLIIQNPPGAEPPPAHHTSSGKPKSNTKSAEDESKTSKSTTKKSQKKLEKQSSTAEKQGSTPEKKAPKTLTKDEEFDMMKTQGNRHVKNEEYQKAIECYSKCVQLFPDKVVSYTNRALCYLKLNQANKAESDCDKSLKKEPANIKAMFRRAQAKKLKQHYRESISDLKSLLSMDPKNSAAKKELEVVKNFWRQELNAMKASMGEGKSKKGHQEGDTATPAPSGSGNGRGKKGSKQRTRLHVHDVDEDNNSSSSSSSQSKSTPVPATKSHGKHHKNSAPKKAEGNTQQNQAPSNNKKGCKSGGHTAPPPPVAAPHIDKATPYEFLKAWNSLKTVRNTKPYADLLAQVPPEDLPKMISNKLDASMLNLITRCVSEHYADRGTAELGLQILSNVTKVERFQTIAMFMSSKEKSDLLCLLETLAAHQTLYGEEDMQKLKHEYGLK